MRIPLKTPCTLQVLVLAVLTCNGLAGEAPNSPVAAGQDPGRRPYEYLQAVPEPYNMQPSPYRKSYESPPQPYSHIPEIHPPLYNQPHQPQPNQRIPVDQPEGPVAKPPKEPPIFNQRELRQPDYNQPAGYNQPQPLTHSARVSQSEYNQPGAIKTAAYNQPVGYNQPEPHSHPAHVSQSEYNQPGAIKTAAYIQPVGYNHPESHARESQPEYYNQPGTIKTAAYNQPAGYQPGYNNQPRTYTQRDLGVPTGSNQREPHNPLRTAKGPPGPPVQHSQPDELESRHEGDIKVVYSPDALYEPEEIYKASPFYNAQPGFIEYAPVSHTRPKYQRRKINKSPPFYHDRSKSDEAKPSGVSHHRQGKLSRPKNAGRAMRIQNPPVYQTPPVYTSFSDEGEEPAREYIQPKGIRKYAKSHHARRGEVKSPHRELHGRKHAVPVPFIKVIKFYPLEEGDFDSEEDEEAPRNDRGYKHKVQEEDYRERSKSGRSNSTYDHYMPVYYDPPKYRSGGNHTENHRVDE